MTNKKLRKRKPLIISSIILVGIVIAYLYIQNQSFCRGNQKFRIQDGRVYINTPENPEISSEVTNADPNTFNCVNHSQATSHPPWYWKDKNYLYDTDGGIIEGEDIDPATFRHIGGPHYEDKNHALFYTTIISGADVDTFEHVGGWYSKDKNRVYYRDVVVNGADPNTFMMLKNNNKVSGNYAKDKNTYYYNGEVISKGD